MSTPTVQPHEKRAFIHWFLNQYQMKMRESNWILTYLASSHKLLQNVHFVRHAKYCPRGMVISSNCSNGVAFHFYREQLVTRDPEKAFHDIRLNEEEPLYVELNFHQWKQCPQYALILEENPFLSSEDFITEKDKRNAERIINYSIQKQRKEGILKAIDRALDERDPIKFQELTNELRKLEFLLKNQ